MPAEKAMRHVKQIQAALMRKRSMGPVMPVARITQVLVAAHKLYNLALILLYLGLTSAGGKNYN